MLGPAGALCCLTAGAALGSWMKQRRLLRLSFLRSAVDALCAMRLMLEEQRPALPELLEGCAACASGEVLPQRLRLAARHLRQEPLAGVEGAWKAACAQTVVPWEQEEEKAALERLFIQLGTGTAAMREQAVAACLRRVKPLCEKAQQEAEKSGRLCMQLGLLLGLMAGIALW